MRCEERYGDQEIEPTKYGNKGRRIDCTSTPAASLELTGEYRRVCYSLRTSVSSSVPATTFSRFLIPPNFILSFLRLLLASHSILLEIHISLSLPTQKGEKTPSRTKLIKSYTMSNLVNDTGWKNPASPQ